MSNLSRRIRNVGRPATGAIGFAPSMTAERPAQVLVLAEARNGASAQAALDAGAEGLVVPPEGVAESVRAAGTRPVGVRLAAASVEAVDAAARDGADFLLFDDASTPAAALLPRRGEDGRAALGRVLLLDDDRSDERLQSLGALNLDAVLVEPPADDLTVRDQLALRRIAALSRAPLLVAWPGGAPSTEALEVWRDAGALLVLVPAEGDTVQAAVAAARQVPPPHRERDERRMPLIPSIAHPGEHEEYEPL